MKVSEIITRKDQIGPDDIPDLEEPNGPLFVVDPKWTEREVYDHALATLHRCGDLDAMTVPLPVLELIAEFSKMEEELQKRLEIKTELIKTYQDRVVQLEAELFEASDPKKKRWWKTYLA